MLRPTPLVALRTLSFIAILLAQGVAPAVLQTPGLTAQAAAETSDVARLEEELAAAQQALSQAVARNQRYQQQIAELQQQASQSSSSGQAVSSSDSAQLGKRLQEARVGLSKAIVTINEQNSRIQSLQEKVEQLETANQNYSALQEQVRQLESALAQKNSGTSSPASQAVKAPDPNPALKQQLQQAQKDLATARQQITQLEDKLSSAAPAPLLASGNAVTLTALQQELQAVRQQQSQLKTQLAQARQAETQQKQLEAQLVQARQTIASLQQQVSQKASAPAAKPLPAATSPTLLAENKRLQALLDEARQTINLLTDRLDAASEKTAVASTPPARPANVPIPQASSADDVLLSQGRQALKSKASGALILPRLVSAQRQQPGNAELALLLAELYSQQGQEQAIVPLLEPLVASDRLTSTQRQSAQRLMGKAYLAQGNTASATKAYQASLPVDSLTNLASALKKQGQLEEAEAALKAALSITPNDPQLHYNLGNLYNKRNQLDAARRSYKKALSLDPNLGPALYNLGLLEVADNQIAAARAYLRQYLQLHPKASDRQAIEALLASF